MNKVSEIIKTEINNLGSISFARFMELALYCPDCGYYEKIEDRVGRQGDFYTSVSVGSLFGQLLAVRFSQWLEDLAPKGLFRHSAPTVGNDLDPQTPPALVEVGAHDGQLALDILTWFQTHHQEQFESLRYYIIEPSQSRRATQQNLLAAFSNHVFWVPDLDGLRSAFSPASFRGVIFSNELMDAMPVQVYRWNAAHSGWIEQGVSLRNDSFAWVPLSAKPVAFEQLLSLEGLREVGTATAEDLSNLAGILPDSFTVEVSTTAAKWWKKAANCLDHGWLLTLDYGYLLNEILTPSRVQGSLRAYRNHRILNDVLADPGEQDITAHVDFGSLQRAGESCGLKTEELTSQSGFLTHAASSLWKLFPGEWNSKATRQFETLTHPDHLGRKFRVLVQSRGMDT